MCLVHTFEKCTNKLTLFQRVRTGVIQLSPGRGWVVNILGLQVISFLLELFNSAVVMWKAATDNSKQMHVAVIPTKFDLQKAGS